MLNKCNWTCLCVLQTFHLLSKKLHQFSWLTRGIGFNPVGAWPWRSYEFQSHRGVKLSISLFDEECSRLTQMASFTPLSKHPDSLAMFTLMLTLRSSSVCPSGVGGLLCPLVELALLCCTVLCICRLFVWFLQCSGLSTPGYTQFILQHKAYTTLHICAGCTIIPLFSIFTWAPGTVSALQHSAGQTDSFLLIKQVKWNAIFRYNEKRVPLDY